MDRKQPTRVSYRIWQNHRSATTSAGYWRNFGKGWSPEGRTGEGWYDVAIEVVNTSTWSTYDPDVDRVELGISRLRDGDRLRGIKQMINEVLAEMEDDNMGQRIVEMSTRKASNG